MTDRVLAVAAVAPLLAEPTLRAEQVTQLLLGESAEIREHRGEWRLVRTRFDSYDGWVHAGYLRHLTAGEADAWDAGTTWSDGVSVTLEATRGTMHIPLRARVGMAGGGILLPDGRRGCVVDGVLRSPSEALAAARREPVVAWILTRYTGSPYLWGGLTPAGVDCSGLVQTAWAARGVPLPRDAQQQATAGDPVALDAVSPGDLLFFRDAASDRVTHVAVVGAKGWICHSALARGGVVHESTGPGTPGAALMERVVAARRLPHA